MFGSALLDTAEHAARPWRIHQIAMDFRVLDVWALPTPGGTDDFPRLVRLMATFDPAETSAVVRAMFAIRWTIGRVFGLDGQETGLGTRVRSLRDRLPADLADTPSDFDVLLAGGRGNRKKRAVSQPSFFAIHRAYFLLLLARDQLARRSYAGRNGPALSAPLDHPSFVIW